MEVEVQTLGMTHIENRVRPSKYVISIMLIEWSVEVEADESRWRCSSFLVSTFATNLHFLTTLASAIHIYSQF